MPSLFDPNDTAAILSRIQKLNPASRRQWGIMRVDQMLAHTQQPLRVAMGELKLKRGLLGRLMGGYVKRQILSKGFRQNAPTAKEFRVSDHRQFEQERSQLTALVQRFAVAGPDGISQEPHPFFGKMTPEEWDRLQWLHLDHHLRQFGV